LRIEGDARAPPHRRIDRDGRLTIADWEEAINITQTPSIGDVIGALPERVCRLDGHA
jgi:hypothetical protein